MPIWMLGSSLYGAQLAAMLGLPYAFASHFAPAALSEALDVYRETFRPSDQLDRPHVMIGTNVFAAETDAEARRLATSMMQASPPCAAAGPAGCRRPMPVSPRR